MPPLSVTHTGFSPKAVRYVSARFQIVDAEYETVGTNDVHKHPFIAAVRVRAVAIERSAPAQHLGHPVGDVGTGIGWVVEARVLDAAFAVGEDLEFALRRC